MIIAGGGRRVFRLSSKVTRIIVGEGAEVSLIDTIKRHPLGARCMKVTWLLQKLEDSALVAKAEQELSQNTMTNTSNVLLMQPLPVIPSQAHNWLLSQQEHYEDSFQSAWVPVSAPTISWNPLKVAKNIRSEILGKNRPELLGSPQAFTVNGSRRPIEHAGIDHERAFPADSQVVHFDDGFPLSDRRGKHS
jgi:hypothetical protein